MSQSTYLELHRVSSVRHVLTAEATKTFVTSLVLSRLTPYMSDLLHLYILFPSLRFSAYTRTFRIPKRKKKSSKGNALLPIWALSHGINCHTLYAMLQQNPSSKLNSKPHSSSQPMDQTPKCLLFPLPVIPPPSPLPPPHLTPFPTDLPTSLRACVRACVCVC